MLKSFFGRKPVSNLKTTSLLPEETLVEFHDDGVLCRRITPVDLETLQGDSRVLAAYLLQLEQEGHLSLSGATGLLTWNSIFQFLDDPELADGVALLGLPSELRVVPVLASQGGLSDHDFSIFIREWRTVDGQPIDNMLARQGALFSSNGGLHRLPPAVWFLIQAVRHFIKQKLAASGEAINRSGWANIRKAAKAAGAQFDGFLDRTVVLQPDSIRLKIDKSENQGLHVLKVTPYFEDQPDGWIESFDRYQNVPAHYAIPSSDGGITHVIISPEVKSVLQEIRSMPGRRVAGDRALQLLRNPYACLGADANRVIDEKQFEADREAAGFSFLRFRVEAVQSSNGQIELMELHLEALSEDAVPEILIFATPAAFRPFVDELRKKLASGLPCGFWQGYELELSDFGQVQFDDIESLYRRWQAESTGIDFDGLFDLSQYGQRVIGFGAPVKPISPFLLHASGQQWLPTEILNAIGLDGDLLAKWDTDSPELFAAFEDNIRSAVATEAPTVVIPGLGATIPLETAYAVADAWAAKLRVRPSGEPSGEISERSVLHIEHNIDTVDYIESRAEALQLKSSTVMLRPQALLSSVQMREHQEAGVAWLQHLFQCSPTLVSGCLLADDMGLGKTLQLLAFIAGYLEQSDFNEPVMIVAPVSLLDNWENEIRRFFAPRIGPVLKLYGNTLSPLRIPKSQLPSHVTEQGVYNLLVPGWRGDARIVLTTYETLRDQEFSLARQRWSIVVCDEAQKIKNPAALVTQAAKAIPARFKIACTGTPVENSLTDLWCLFDFIQPGFLGSLNAFGRRYRKPADVSGAVDRQNLDELRALIEPQILRRMKSDVAKDLPKKTESTSCRALAMSPGQLSLYKSEIDNYKTRNELVEKVGGANMAMLGLLHTMKLVCAHPALLAPVLGQGPDSPKMLWLLDELRLIKAREEKVIIFTELREIQRVLQLAILDCFGMHVRVINGDTKASSNTGVSRQNLIDEFQVRPGFGVIILSTTAVGFGVNVQAANHVVHFTRCWNPAKEDQATDRAYRIGQTKDVTVYYPTVVAQELETFEVKLDNLLTQKRALADDMLNGAGDIDLLKLVNS